MFAVLRSSAALEGDRHQPARHDHLCVHDVAILGRPEGRLPPTWPSRSRAAAACGCDPRSSRRTAASGTVSAPAARLGGRAARKSQAHYAFPCLAVAILGHPVGPPPVHSRGANDAQAEPLRSSAAPEGRPSRSCRWHPFPITRRCDPRSPYGRPPTSLDHSVPLSLYDVAILGRPGGTTATAHLCIVRTLLCLIATLGHPGGRPPGVGSASRLVRGSLSRPMSCPGARTPAHIQLVHVSSRASLRSAVALKGDRHQSSR